MKVRDRLASYGQHVSCEAYPWPGSHISNVTSTINPANARPAAITIGGSLLPPA